MSVVASAFHHQPFSDTELYVPSGSVSAHAELPPPLPSPIPGSESHSIPFPIFQHRHTSPYPPPHSFSALGPPPPLDMSSHTLSSVSPPPAPKGSPVSLPTFTPEVAPQAPLPLTPDPSPPASKVLNPTMMIKLAPPADDSPYEISFLDQRPEPQFSVQISSDADSTPRRLPMISVDSASSVEPATETPPTRRKSIGALNFIPQTAPAKVVTDIKVTRPKSMGPPPRPRRSQTAYPAPQSVRMTESRSADSRAKLRNHIPPINRQTSHGPMGPRGLSRALSDASANTPPRGVPFTLSANTNEMAPPDLGGPDGLEAKVVLLGSQGVGKTSLILRYTTKNFSPTPAPATIGSSLHARKLVHDGTRVKLQIWDTAGQERFRSMAPIYYRGAHVCVLVYDISDRQSFEDVRSWLDELGRTVPKETVIFVVGAKIDLNKDRVVTFEEARSTIKTWLKPPPAPEPTILLSPPPRSLFRSSTSISRTASPSGNKSNTNTGGPPSRSHSYGALSSLGQATPPVPAPRSAETPRQISPGKPFPVPKPFISQASEKPTPAKIKTSTSPPSVRFLSPTSPSGLAFPSLQSPTKATSATFTDPVGPSITPASAMMGHRAERGSRFSISGVLGLSRTTSLSGAASSLAQLAEMPTSPRQSNDSVRRQSSSSESPSTRVRVESTPLFDSTSFSQNSKADRRKSEDWSSRSWKMGQGPGAAETLGEFGDGVKKKQSGELLVPLSASTGSGFRKHQHQQPQRQNYGTRSRGGSLGRDPRLYGDDTTPSSSSRGMNVNSQQEEEDNDQLWGVQVESIRLGECSALTGQGVEALFKSITSLLVEKKDKIERERVLRRKNSVMLTDPTKDGQVDAEGKNKGYGCCV